MTGMNKLLLIFLLLFSLNMKSQNKVGWSKLGSAEKVWVLLHPFSAKKAKLLTKIAIEDTDSIQHVYNFPNPISGGRKDALRHAYWMALISSRIGERRALWLGKAHEKKGKKDFEKGKLEEGSLPDSVSMQMDLFNNKFGAKLGKFCFECNSYKLLESLLEVLKKGELKIVKYNQQGQSLDKDNQVIPNEEWEGKWINRRILEGSEY